VLRGGPDDYMEYLEQLLEEQRMKDEIKELQQQLTEKDATIERLTAESAIKSEAIKKYENDAEYWYQETEKARSMFLAAHDDKVRLRKALEESEQRIKSVNEGIDEGPQFGMTAWDWRDWMYSTLPFLKEPSEEGDKQ